MTKMLLFLGLVALTTYCIVDVIQRPEDSPHGLPKIVWILLLLFFPFIGALVWLYLRSQGNSRSAPQTRPMSPDDDPEYLRWLAEQERRRKRANEGDKAP
jgi:hypothetical protein